MRGLGVNGLRNRGGRGDVARRARRSGGLAALVAAAAIGLAACGGSLQATSVANRSKVTVQGQGAGTAIDTAYFSQGACVEFPPTNGNRNLTVFLHAGHGGLDPAAGASTQSGQPIYEPDETLPRLRD